MMLETFIKTMVFLCIDKHQENISTKLDSNQAILNWIREFVIYPLC
jgi:hypothetical protein